MKKIAIILLCAFAFIEDGYGQAIKSQNMESIKLKESEDGNIIMERKGNSIYVRFNHGDWIETRQYMDVTSIINADEFITISEKIAKKGKDVRSLMQKPNIESWEYKGVEFIRELSPYWDPCPRHDIKIDVYTFVYVPKGGDHLDIAKYRLNEWNFHVPDYQEDHVYIRIVIDSMTTYEDMTDEELLEASRMQIKKLKKL
jgi:hypothetical protein